MACCGGGSRGGGGLSAGRIGGAARFTTSSASRFSTVLGAGVRAAGTRFNSALRQVRLWPRRGR